MAHIIMVTIGSGGDLYPFIRIGKALKRRGHRITLLTHCVHEQEAREHGFAFVPFDNMAEYRLVMNADMQVQVQDPKAGGDFFRKYLFPKIEESFRKTTGLYDGTPTLLVGHYMIHVLAQMIAEKLQIPYLTVFLAPSFLEGAKTPATMLSYFSEQINYIRREAGLAPIRNWERMMNAYSHGLAFWPQWFSANDWDESITGAGFLLHDNSEDMPDDYRGWMEEHRPVLITHATTPPVSSSFFHSCIEACEMLELPAVVVTKYREHLPRRMPPHMVHADSLPFSKAMPLVKLLIHHGGIGTLGQALQAGIPQLILGNGFDRPRNAVYVKALGVGEYLPISRWKKEDAANAIRRLLGQSDIQQACRSVSDMVKANDPDTIIGEVAERLLAEKAISPSEQSDPCPEGEKVSLQNTIQLLQGLSPESRARLMTKLKARKT